MRSWKRKRISQPGQQVDRSFGFRKQTAQKWATFFCTCLPDGPPGEWCSPATGGTDSGPLMFSSNGAWSQEGIKKCKEWRPQGRILHPLCGDSQRPGAESPVCSLDTSGGTWSPPDHVSPLGDCCFQKAQPSVVIRLSRGDSFPTTLCICLQW